MSSRGLPVSRLIRVTTNLTPVAAQFANFDSLVIAGDSDVIDTHERMRSYSDLASVAADFGTNAPEYLAAVPFFGQSPQPDQLFIARWAKAATHGLLVGGTLTALEQTIATWNAIVAGSFKIAIDGAAGVNVTGLDFSGAANLNAVATAINVALAAVPLAATVAWTGTKFIFKSTATGAASSIGPLVAAGAGVDIGAMLKGTAGTLAYTVDGIAAETPVALAAVLADLPTQWYALSFAAAAFAGPNGTSVLANADSLAVSDFIEGAGLHLYGFTHSSPAALIAPDTTSIAALSHAAGYRRTSYQYSSSNPYAWNSYIGRQFTVNFDGNSTVIDLMYKQEPGVTPETLTTAQANALDSNNNNYFVNFDNQTAIIVNGKQAGDFYTDEIVGTDWLSNQIQTNVYNRLYTATTKIPQTDQGNHQIATAIEAACIQGVTNGLGAPGVWNSGGFGQLAQGDFLPKGFYVYAPPIASQAQANREARESVPFQVAFKLAGSIQTVDVIVDVNR